MRLIHQNCSYDADFISLLRERVHESSYKNKILKFLERALRNSMILLMMLIAESLLALMVFVPLPIYRSFVIRWVQGHDGAIGYYLRSLLFRQKARYVGRNVLIGVNVKIGCFPELNIGDFAYLDRGVAIMCPATLGAHCHLATEVFVSGGGSLELEDYASIGMRSIVLTSTDSPRKGFRASGPMVPIAQRLVVKGETVLRRDAFTGPFTLLFPGAVMKEGSVLSGGSVLRRGTKAWGVYHGNPAVMISKRDPIID